MMQQILQRFRLKGRLASRELTFPILDEAVFNMRRDSLTNAFRPHVEGPDELRLVFGEIGSIYLVLKEGYRILRIEVNACGKALAEAKFRGKSVVQVVMNGVIYPYPERDLEPTQLRPFHRAMSMADLHCSPLN